MARHPALHPGAIAPGRCWAFFQLRGAAPPHPWQRLPAGPGGPAPAGPGALPPHTPQGPPLQLGWRMLGREPDGLCSEL